MRRRFVLREDGAYLDRFAPGHESNDDGAIEHGSPSKSRAIPYR
jgi:hypothetical protein